ncbi:hypothetical protein CI238_10166 [Colletotrichum incanum]|uniref:Uncharacterized protein n=1 Tax=Colletotrichum incanum TaxID=1573173 RepID=A0A162N7W8_COLIC|nr:hypothetical protein CI238_10166 [Colletotrichum incanum]
MRRNDGTFALPYSCLFQVCRRREPTGSPAPSVRGPRAEGRFFHPFASVFTVYRHDYLNRPSVFIGQLRFKLSNALKERYQTLGKSDRLIILECNLISERADSIMERLKKQQGAFVEAGVLRLPDPPAIGKGTAEDIRQGLVRLSVTKDTNLEGRLRGF